MATSDDEVEDLPESVTNYYFVDDGEEPISFSVLPINWNPSETMQCKGRQIYLRGNADGGLDKIYKLVRAWNFDISGVKPEISVLSKDNNWIKLLKPRQSFEEKFIGKVLITVNFLSLVKKHPQWHGKHVWKTLSETFRLYENTPSSKHLIMTLIEQAVNHDESLKKSKFLMTVLERKSQKKHKADEDILVKGKSEFVVSDDDCSSDDLEDDSGDEEDGSGDENSLADEEDDEDEPFDSVCSICDEGGPLLCCEGSCMRSFHATLRAGKPSNCRSLGFTEKEVEAMPYFKCKNCQYKLHQCFSCGLLGSSDKQTGAKVFQCINATCGYFYHPHCVAKRLHGNDDAATEVEEKIRAGESFTCPLHTCFVCKQAEDKTDPKLQMAVCRRCPKAYHRKCLPRKIAFEEDEDAGVEQRAWEGLLVDRILIYCLKHQILDDLGTPSRDHIKFGDDDKVALRKKVSSLRAPSLASPALESKKKTVEDSVLDKKDDRRVTKLQKSNSSTKWLSEKKPALSNIDGSFRGEERKCLKPCQTEKLGEIETKTAVKKFVPKLGSDSERRILDLMNEASSIITLDDIIAKHEKIISSRLYKQKMDPCKVITLGKVEKSCEAVCAANKKLESSTEDAKDAKAAKGICEPQILSQLVKWKSKLRVYLAPFLIGMRYTSFGRHFTKPEKLQEIADALHWYVKDDDTIVDFCCGANDFSLFMKEKLEKRGRKCNYKNYDLFRPKKDFCFETRNWMDVQPNELPTGSKLIMGLNPPFGVKASLANQFINKALQFKPKLIILIVPPETERLDKKKIPYDLVWEDKVKLSGKSFYLPGSVNTSDKQMDDWNVVPPVLYLWSRQDWTSKHLDIAKTHHRHLLEGQRENNPQNRLDRDSSFKKRGQSSKAMEIDDNASPPQTHPTEDLKERAVDVEKQSAPKDDRPSIDKQVKATPQSNRSKKRNEKKKRQREMVRGGPVESSHDYKRRHLSPHEPRPRAYEVARHSPHPHPHVATRDYPASPPPKFESAHDEERRFSVERMTRYHSPPSNVEIGSVNYVNPHHHHPQDDIYPSERERYQHPTFGNTRSRSRSQPHAYEINEPPYIETVPAYPGPSTYRTETSGYTGRVDHVMSGSAIDKYNFGLNATNVTPRMGGAGYGHGHGPGPDMGPRPDVVPDFYPHHHHPPPPRPEYSMGFAPGPANPYYSSHTSSGGWIHD
ncbi:protein ENHANCED DOWNY MILDEW 2 [Spinacia oleracea]|uniref:Protein ENHANCED DOWNY MILDEW 2 n=1 Tax=Spinacia oleracea TaxID=3562 RepID=A0A9R0JWG3_SPIOL|nr:protein ENHANCED DOWNY MILDEW 2-like [Spinacia oleracea]